MKSFLVTLIIAVACAVGVVYSGIYPVGVLQHDNRLINWGLRTAMVRSVQHQATDISVPPLTDPAMISRGLDHFGEMCVSCHGAPGVEPDEIANGLWPKAPDLAKSAAQWTPAELFWITKNGIKYTAMPAWGPSHTDSEIWAMVAGLQKLPHMSAQDYKAAHKMKNP